MSGRRITRARLLAAALAAATPLALAGLEPWRRLVEIERRTPARRLAALLRDRKAAGAIGAAYLRARPRERTVAGLVRALARGLPGGRSALATASDEELRALLAARTADDFEEGRTVTVDGWILARTEARLYALAFLLDA